MRMIFSEFHSIGSVYHCLYFFSSLSFVVSFMFNYSAESPPPFINFSNISKTVPQTPNTSISSDIDVVAEFLKIVAQFEQNKENCKAGQYDLGEGVIKQYGKNRFKQQALVAVNRANLLTRLWKEAEPEVLNSEYLFFTQVRNFVEGDDEIFAAGNCYDYMEFKDYYLFCPYAYRMEDGRINVKDLSVEYDYLGNTSEFFYSAKVNAGKLENFNFTNGTAQPRYNQSMHGDVINDSVITVTYENGHWSKPYFDCGGGDIWMMTYTVPFFGYKNGTFKFKGTSGIDIALDKVDIDQCPQPEDATEPNVFAGSARCKPETTKCEPLRGLGFKRGSYKCVCKDGFYFPFYDQDHLEKYFNGSEIENEYEKKMKGVENKYDDLYAFQCFMCEPGCITCDDPSPCVLTLNWIMRSILLAISILILCGIPLLVWFTVQYRDVKVLKAASPVLMRIILLGAFFLYCPLIVGYFEASVVTCILRFWFREIGFSISYGALLLKTWRISVVFRVRSAQRVKISDGDLIKRLLLITLVCAAYLTARTIAGTPRVVEGKHVNGLKTYQCSSDWWDHSAAIAELLFLLWGVRLCIVVRKAPSEFNESRFISWAIYNETLLSLFLNVSMIFLQDPFPANPDLMYLVIFIHTQLTTTVTLTFLFGSKMYLVYKYREKGESNGTHTTMLNKSSKSTFNAKQSINMGSAHSNNVNCYTYTDRHEDNECDSLLEKDIQEEFRRLYTQLETLKQRNMKIGNRHLQHKLSAMTEAAQKESPKSSPSSTPLLNGKRVIINLDLFKESSPL
ncbi:probable G-protein coupled receptor CG31760 [Saccostrea cucullata]|uniref:probable G-protein coupled receptor CG31760 n=1 Tax=Saccostrea cuccullata TaxID=36930 RepID=UPI002ED5BDD3